MKYNPEGPDFMEPEFAWLDYVVDLMINANASRNMIRPGTTLGTDGEAQLAVEYGDVLIANQEFFDTIED